MFKSKLVFVVLGVIFLALPVVGHAQEPFRGMKLLTQNTGWAAMGPALYWTNDFGQDWREITPPGVSPRGQATIADVFFLNTSDGWVLLRTPGGPYGDWSFELASTDDAGITWSVTPVSFPDWKSDTDDPDGGNATIDFTDASHGWLDLSLQSSTAFNYGLLFATSDGGSTWKWVPAPVGFGSARFTSDQVGWVAGGPGNSELVVTRDGGKTWGRVRVTPPPGFPQNANPIYWTPIFTGPRRAVLPVSFGWTAAFYTSHDGGRTWRLALALKSAAGPTGSVTLPMAVFDSSLQLPTRRKGGRLRLSKFSLAAPAGSATGEFPSQYMLQSASFADPGRGWVSAAGDIYATSDGGATWTDITPKPRNQNLSPQ